MLQYFLVTGILLLQLSSAFAQTAKNQEFPNCPREWTNDSAKVERMFQNVLDFKGVFKKVAIEDNPSGFSTKQISLVNSGGRIHVHVSAGIDITRPAQVCKVAGANQLKINFESGFIGPVTFTLKKFRGPSTLQINGPHVNNSFTAQ